jgi:hypothetical protein
MEQIFKNDIYCQRIVSRERRAFVLDVGPRDWVRTRCESKIVFRVVSTYPKD